MSEHPDQPQDHIAKGMERSSRNLAESFLRPVIEKLHQIIKHLESREDR